MRLQAVRLGRLDLPTYHHLTKKPKECHPFLSATRPHRLTLSILAPVAVQAARLCGAQQAGGLLARLAAAALEAGLLRRGRGAVWMRRSQSGAGRLQARRLLACVHLA